MANLKDWKPGEQIKALVYGRFKVGKTFGAGTFPRPNVIDFDGGLATLTNPDWIRRYGTPDIEYETFHEKNLTAQGIVKTANAFDDACVYFDKWMKPGYRDRFDTWIVDSGTKLSAYAQNKAIALMGDTAFTGPKVMSVTHKNAMKHGMVFPKIQDYGAERSLVDQFVQMVYDSGKNFLFICHEKELLNNDGNVTSIVPLLTGRGVDEISLKFDEVWNLQARRQGTGMVRVLQTQADGIRYCGSRIGVPTGIEWDYKTIITALEARYAEAKQLMATNKGV